MEQEKILATIEAHVEVEAEKMFQSVNENNQTVGEWMLAMWELGQPQKEGTDIEKMLHQLTYMRFSEKARNTILKIKIESGCMTINEARVLSGLNPHAFPGANDLLRKE